MVLEPIMVPMMTNKLPAQVTIKGSNDFKLLLNAFRGWDRALDVRLDPTKHAQQRLEEGSHLFRWGT